MLTPERIPFIVFTVPPILLLIVIFFTHPAVRRLLGAFVGGLAFAVLHISWDTVAHSAGWWRYPFTTEAHAPLVWYMGSVFWGATSALIGWRLQRRWGLRGLIIFLVAVGVLGTVSDLLSAWRQRQGVVQHSSPFFEAFVRITWHRRFGSVLRQHEEETRRKAAFNVLD